MYGDPTLIRDHVVKLRLNDHEAALVNAIVDYTGQQKAALLRELLIEKASSVLAGLNDAGAKSHTEVPARA